jgi:cytochrome c oxidase cbb3-type subunit 2
MPPYAFLAERPLDPKTMASHMTALRRLGVPYSDEDIAKAAEDMVTQGTGEGDTKGLAQRYPKSQARDFDGDPGKLTEMDALVAYLQGLGTQVDFKSAQPRERAR